METTTKLLDLEAAAERLAVGQKPLRRLIARGVLVPVRLPGVRRTLVKERDLGRLIAGQDASDAPGAA